MSRENEVIGKPLDRVDGHLKVTGAAHYSADWPFDNLAYGVLITSTIARGRILAMDTHAAEQVPGVLAVMTPFECAAPVERQHGGAERAVSFWGTGEGAGQFGRRTATAKATPHP